MSEDSTERSASRFQILNPHAKGGLGEVFIARDNQLNREVALKQIRANLANNQDLASRFRVEAELTGGLEHPGIVPVYGLGQNEDGTPYYAMKLIRGESLKQAIHEFFGGKPDAEKPIDAEQFRSVAFRRLLQSFVSVCYTIHYAHSRGVIHRDIKPDNIMIGDFNETLVVDWGIAKTIGRRTPETLEPLETMYAESDSNVRDTRQGRVVGTPGYMSPEQALGWLDNLTIQSDVFSLGATLFSMLTGQIAFTGDSAEKAIMKTVQVEFRPPRESNSSVPAALNAICVQAMAKSSKERYSTAEAMAQDLEAWLAGEKVSAWQEPFMQRVQRWVRKHRTMVSSLAAAVTVLAVASTIAAVLLMAANRRESEARSIATEQKNQAVLAREQSESLVAYLEDVIRSTQDATDGPNMKVATLLQRSMPEIDERFQDDPLSQARLLNAVGQSYGGLGLYADAIPPLEKAVRLREEYLGSQDIATLGSQNNLAVAYLENGDFDRAIKLLEHILESKSFMDDDDLKYRSMGNLAVAYLNAGQTKKALELSQQSMLLCEQEFGPTSALTLLQRKNYIEARVRNGEFDAAVQQYKQLLQDCERELPAGHEQTRMVRNNLASALNKSGAVVESRELMQEAIQQYEDFFGPDHPRTLGIKLGLVDSLRNSGDVDEAIELGGNVFEQMQASLEKGHPLYLQAANNLAMANLQRGDLGVAIELLEECNSIAAVTLGVDHLDTLNYQVNYADALQRTNRLDEAIAILKSTIPKLEKVSGIESMSTLIAKNTYAVSLLAANEPEQAEQILEQIYPVAENVLGPQHPQTILYLSNLATTLGALGKFDRAIQLRRDSLGQLEDKLGEFHPRTIFARGKLAQLLEQTGEDEEEFVALFEKALKDSQEHSPNPETTMGIANDYAVGLLRIGKVTRAIELLQESTTYSQEKLGYSHRTTWLFQTNLAVAYAADGNYQESIELLDGLTRSQIESIGITNQSINTMELRCRQHWAWCRQSDQESGSQQIDDAEQASRDYVSAGRKFFVGDDKTRLASQLASQSLELINHQRYSLAEEWIRECLQIRQVQMADSWLLFNTKCMLGRILLQQQQLDEGRELLIDGYQGMMERVEQIPDAGRPRLREAVTALIELAKDSDDAEAIEKWQSELDALPNQE